MSHNYTTALSYLVLAGTGITCLSMACNRMKWSYGHSSFLIISVNAVIGLWRWGNPDYGHNVGRFYRVITDAQLFCALPLITTQIWYIYNYQNELIYAHLAFAIVPYILYLCSATHDNFIDLILFLNTISLGAVSIMEENHWGIAAAVSYGISYMILVQKESIFEIPSTDLFNYALSFFTYFAFNAMLA